MQERPDPDRPHSPSDTAGMRRPGDEPWLRGLLVTAGPTQEPIDAVRFVGNRSSGRLGVALADEAARRGASVTLLLGPSALAPVDPRVRVLRFRTTADLQRLLGEHFSRCGMLIQAAAVADYRPVAPVVGNTPHHATPGGPEGGGEGVKLRREPRRITIELEPTPDLLAHCAGSRAPGQSLIGFALEPRDRLRASALDKLARKNVDAVIANPLETMESPTIDAEVFLRDGASWRTDGPMPKERFANWLLDRLATLPRRAGE